MIEAQEQPLPNVVSMGEYGDRLRQKFPTCEMQNCPRAATVVLFGNVLVCSDHADLICHRVEDY